MLLDVCATARRDDRDPAQQCRHRHSCHLPVPVDCGVNEKGDVCGERGSRETKAACPWCHYQRNRESRAKERKAERSHLGELLEVKVVRVADLEVERAVPVPLLFECAGSRAEPRMRGDIPPGDLPELRSSVAGKAEQPSVQVV